MIASLKWKLTSSYNTYLIRYKEKFESTIDRRKTKSIFIHYYAFNLIEIKPTVSYLFEVEIITAKYLRLINDVRKLNKTILQAQCDFDILDAKTKLLLNGNLEYTIKSMWESWVEAWTHSKKVYLEKS